MSRRSLESERPIMASSVPSSKRTSKRYSTFSTSPSFATVEMLESTPNDQRHPGGNLNISAASGMQEIKNLTKGLNRLDNKKLEEQRFVPTQKKTDEIKSLSIGAKIEKTLGRRMTNQDATFKNKRISILGNKHMDVVSEKI